MEGKKKTGDPVFPLMYQEVKIEGINILVLHPHVLRDFLFWCFPNPGNRYRIPKSPKGFSYNLLFKIPDNSLFVL